MKAFVLHRWPYSETDLIVEFYLEHSGIQKLFAMAAKRSKRRFPHQFHSAGLYEVEFKDQRLQSCELVEYFDGIANQLEVWSRWMCVLEWIRVDEAATISFEELLSLAQKFHRDESGRDIFLQFFVQQAERHGLLPSLESCQHCEAEFGGGELNFSFSEGGLCHPRCRDGVSYPSGALEYLQSLRLDALQGPTSLASQEAVEASIVPFLEFQLGKKLKSFHFLRRIQQAGQNSQEKSWQNLSSPMF